MGLIWCRLIGNSGFGGLHRDQSPLSARETSGSLAGSNRLVCIVLRLAVESVVCPVEQLPSSNRVHYPIGSDDLVRSELLAFFGCQRRGDDVLV